MNRYLAWDPQAFAALTAIQARDPELAERILLAVERYAETGQGNVRKLTDRFGLRRLRVGDWRVLFKVDRAWDGYPRMIVVHLSDRRDAYR
jgi:mRNA-degrading endonuclease RelE of RelBE toxin-antitoxin system